MYLVVTRSFPPELGGMQNLMWGLTNSIAKYNLTKVFADYQENHKEVDDSVSFSIERVSGAKLIRKYRKAYLVNEFINKNKKVECIIADHWKSLELIKSDKKKVCLIHSKEINHDKGSRSNKRVLNVLNNVDHVVSNSEYTKNLAINCGINSSKITVINPGVNPAKELNKKAIKESENLLKNKNPRLITVSRLDKRKNHEKIIMTLRNLKQIYPNIIYTCVGDGEEEENLKQLVKELGLGKQVLFLKKISQDLKNTLVAKSSIFVMPSVIYKKSVEGFGIAFVEAAQYGISSVGGKDGGASDAVIHDKTGLIIDGNNLEEIYQGIINLLSDKKYIEYGVSAKKNAEKFEWSKIIKKYLEIIKD